MTGTDMTVNSVISIRAYGTDILPSRQIAGLDFSFDARCCAEDGHGSAVSVHLA